jgi:hypothetical protein
MFNRLCIGTLLLAGLVLSLNGCNTSSTSGTSGLTTIVISPSTVTVELAPPGYQQGHSQFTAIGYYGHADHQSTRDITSEVTWASSGTQVATVNSSGLATATGWNTTTGEGWVGNTNITASASGYNGEIVSNSATFTVTDCQSCADTDISAITVSPATQTVATLGIGVQFEALGKTVSGDTVSLPNLSYPGKIKWTSSVPTIATVDPTSGVATTVSAGTTYITATFTNKDGSGASATATLIVAPSGSPEPLTSMAVSPSQQTSLAVGDTANFQAIATTNGGPTINLTNQSHTVDGHVIQPAVWSSSSSSVATINSSTGVATAVSAGVAFITATAYNPDGTMVIGSSTYTVTVSSGTSTEPLVSLTIQPSSQVSLTTGAAANVNFIAIGTLGSGGTVLLTNAVQTVKGQTIDPVSWTSSNPSVASISSSSGVATPNSAGATAITAVVTNPDKTQVTATVPYTVTVSKATEPLVSLAVSPTAQSVQVGNTSANFIAVATTGSGTTVNLTDPKTYTVPGTLPAQIIKWAQWTSSDPAVAAIDPNTGIITAKAAGVTTITAIATNPDNTVVSNSAALTVTAVSSEPLVSLAVLPTTQTSLATGKAADVNFIAIGTTASGATVNMTSKPYTDPASSKIIPVAQWSSSNPTVASFASPTGGVATPNGGGTTAITAIVTNPDGTVVTGSAAYTVTVSTSTEPLVSLAVLPTAQTSLATGTAANVNFIAIGTTSSGATVNMTTKSYTDPVSLKVIPVAQWSSSNPAVASFATPTGGVATPNATGATVITAIVTNPDGTVVTGSAAYTVTVPAVTEPYVSLAIVPASQTLTVVGQQTQFLAIGTTGSGTTVDLTSAATWSCSDVGGTVVNQIGTTNVFSAVGNGAVTVTAIVPNPGIGSKAADGTSVTATGSLTVAIGTPEPLLSLSILPNSQSVPGIGQKPTQFLAIGDFAASSSTPGSQNMANITTYTVNWYSSNPSVATIGLTTGLVTATGEGTTAITAVATNNADKSGATATGAAVELISALSIYPGSPSLTLPVIGSTTPATVNFTAIGTNGSTGLQTDVNSLTGIRWTSTNPLVATIDSTGKATAVSAGTTTIGVTYTNPASAGSGIVTATTTLTIAGAASEPLVSLTVLPATQTSLTTGTSANVNFIAIGTTASGATVNMTTLPYTVPGTSKVISVAQWSSSNKLVASFATLTGGVATPNGNGTTAITAIVTNPDGTVVTGSAAYTVTVPATTEPYVSLAIVPASQTLTSASQVAQFIAIGTTGKGGTVDLTSKATWGSSSTSVASPGVLPGQFTPGSNGVAAITATYKNSLANGDASDLTSVTASGAITVAIPATQEPLLSMSILPGSQSATVGQTTQFQAMGDFSSSSPGPGAGTRQLPVSSTVTGNSYNYTVTWYSSNPAVATVCTPAGTNTTALCATTPGLVTAVGQGTTAITAIASGNPDGSVVTAMATYTVTGPSASAITSLSIFPATQTITMPVIGQADPIVNFVVIGTNGAGFQTNETTSVSWVSSDPAVATFCYPAPLPAGWTNSTGCPSIIDSVLVIGVGPGTSTLTASYTNTVDNTITGIVTANASLTVTGSAAERLLSLAINPDAPSVPFPTQKTQLSAIGTFSQAPVTQDLTKTVTWESSNPLIATVCNATATTTVPISCATTPGLVTAVGKGSAAITATDSTTNSDYSLVFSTVPFTVSGGSAEQMSALTIIPGSLSLSATGQPGGLIALGTSGSTGLLEDVTDSLQLVWISSNPTIATVCTVAAGNVTALCPTTPGQVSGVSAGSTDITAEFINQAAVGSTPAQVVTAQASVDVTSTPAAEPLLSITALPTSTTDQDLEGTAQYLAYGTFSTAPTLLDITNGFFHQGFPDAACTAAYASANAATVAEDSAANLPVTTLPHAECSFVPVTWISTAPYIFPINSAGTAGATGGLSTADGSGSTDIYAVAANPDTTLVYSPIVVFNCPYAAPTYGTKQDNGVTVPDYTVILNPGTCNTLTIADSLLSTLTVFNAGVNTTGWLITAPSATGTADVIHCGGSVEQATLEGSVCEATYPNGTEVILTAPAEPTASPAVNFGGWSDGCTPCTLSGGVCTAIAAPPFYTAAGPNYCKVTVGGDCTLNIHSGTYTCANSSNVAVGAIFN